MMTILRQDCDIVLTLPPDTGEAAVSWLQTKLRGVAGGQLGVTTRYRYRYRYRYRCRYAV